MVSQSLLDSAHESKLVGIINEAIRVNNKRPIDIATDSMMIGGIWSASKFSGLSRSYSDIILDQRNRKPIQISLEDIDAEFVLKTNAIGLNLIYPGILVKFINEVRRQISEDGSVIDFCGKIPRVATEEMIRGITVFGGPVDYYFFANKKLEHSFDTEEMILTFTNSSFVTPKEVAKDKIFYLSFTQEADKDTLMENRVNLIKHAIEISTKPTERIINIF